jgi:hypothetical protein
MNRIQRIAAAAVVSTVVLTPATAAVAFAEPRPWHNPNGETSESGGLTKTKAQIEYEERLQLANESGTGNDNSGSESAVDPTSFPWETVGLAALGAGILATGGAVVARRHSREPHPA